MTEQVWRIGEPPVFISTTMPSNFVDPFLAQLYRGHAVTFMLEHSADVIVVFDSDWRLVYANLQWEKNTGLSRETSKGITLWEYAPSMLGSDLEQTYRHCMETKQACTFTCLHPVTQKYVITWVYPGENTICIQLRDVTDFKLLDDTRVRKALEIQRWNEELESRVEKRTQDLKKAQEFNARVIKDSMDGIVGLDTNLEIFAWNPTMERLTGISKEKVLGQSILLLFPASKHKDITAILHRVLAGETIIFRGESYLMPDTRGEEFESLGGSDYERYYMPMAGDVDGTVVGAVINYKNIATQNQIKYALTKARDEALSLAKIKSEFLANMSHELRTPLNAIIGLTDLLKETNLDTQQREYFEIMQGSAISLLNIVNHVLDFSKYEVGKMPLVEEDFALSSVVQSSAAVFEREAQRKNLVFECHFLDDLNYYTVHGDPVRLRQVLVNLVNNAIKFTSRGFVRVVVSQVADPGGKNHREDSDDESQEDELYQENGSDDETVGEAKEGKKRIVWVGITVEDSGVGMSETTLKALFTPFTQADASTTRLYGGTGLGLAIVKQIVEYVGGGVNVTSKEDVGTSFHVRIPFQVASIDKPQITKIIKKVKKMRERRNTIAFDATGFGSYLIPHDISEDENEEQQEEVEEPTVIENTEVENVIVRARSDSVLDNIEENATNEENTQSLQHNKQQHTSIASNLQEPASLCTWIGRKRSKSGTFERYFGTGSSSLMDSPPPPPPVVTPAPTRRRSLERANSGPSQRSHCLVVEDNEVNKKVLTLLLQRLKWTVDVCSNGIEAVSTLTNNPDKFDLVLMDVQMPLMDGYTAAEEIRKDERLTNIPIIAMTANAMPGDKERCLDSGMDDYMAKPVNMKVLVPILETWGKKQDPSAPNNNSPPPPSSSSPSSSSPPPSFPSSSSTSPLSSSQA